MERKLRIGVFGGGRGINMVETLLDNECDRAELVAVCDQYVPLLKKVKKLADQVGIQIACFERFDDFIEYDMDAVVLANYATEHAPYAIRCLKAGKHVMSEVLPCETLAQAVELVETVEQTGKIYVYAENYCYMENTFEMWRRYRSGEIGEILYAEGEYIHDCSSDWTRLSFGERNHWRNLAYATFYCTHSLGPILHMTGLRPVKVVGYETPMNPCNLQIGVGRGSGLEMVTLENGAVVKSLHGWLKREPEGPLGEYRQNYSLYGQKGCMETGRLQGSSRLNVYREGDKLCHGTWERFDPTFFVDVEKQGARRNHGGSDFYPTHFFIDKILGNSNGDMAIDIYEALDMSLCGIFAWRSVLNGNIPMEIPNLRDPAQRELWRNDHTCTNPVIAGDQVVPACSHPVPEIPEAVFDRLKQLLAESKDANGDVKDYF